MCSHIQVNQYQAQYNSPHFVVFVFLNEHFYYPDKIWNSNLPVLLRASSDIARIVYYLCGRAGRHSLLRTTRRGTTYFGVSSYNGMKFANRGIRCTTLEGTWNTIGKWVENQPIWTTGILSSCCRYTLLGAHITTLYIKRLGGEKANAAQHITTCGGAAELVLKEKVKALLWGALLP